VAAIHKCVYSCISYRNYETNV